MDLQTGVGSLLDRQTWSGLAFYYRLEKVQVFNGFGIPVFVSSYGFFQLHIDPFFPLKNIAPEGPHSYLPFWWHSCGW